MYVADDKRYDSMQYRRSGRSGIKLPAISLGLWHNFGGVDNFENSRAMLRRAFDLGITHFDLANNYGPPPGSAESNFGRILREDGRGGEKLDAATVKSGRRPDNHPFGRERGLGRRSNLMEISSGKIVRIPGEFL